MKNKIKQDNRSELSQSQNENIKLLAALLKEGEQKQEDKIDGKKRCRFRYAAGICLHHGKQ